MDIDICGRQYTFQPWRPHMGQVFHDAFAFACETSAVDEARPYITPAYVIGAATDGQTGFFVSREHVGAFFAAHGGHHVITHNAPRTLDVINLTAPQVDIYRGVDKGKIWDTNLLSRLLILATQGHTTLESEESDLDRCAKKYLSIDLPSTATDSNGNVVSISYGRWLTRPPQEIESVYLDLLARRAIAVRVLFEQFGSWIRQLLSTCNAAWGYLSDAWLNGVSSRWGPLTHHIQLRAAIVLQKISANGLYLDLEKIQGLAESLKSKAASLEDVMREFGYLPDAKGSGKAVQAILARIERNNPHVRLRRTNAGASDVFSTSRDALQEFAGVIPFVGPFLDYEATKQLLNSFAAKHQKRILHPTFDVLAKTGRTTSYGEINAQSVPKDDAVRTCFIPSPGHVFVVADYKTIELAALAQACHSQFRLESKMLEAINQGKDLHALVAAKVLCIPENDVTRDDRSKAKPINFGKPGGMGDSALRGYARASYGVELTNEEVRAFSDKWFELFPEMKEFLEIDIDVPYLLARWLSLRNTSRTSETAASPASLAILGGMALRTFGADSPTSRGGKPYDSSQVDHFWAQLGQAVAWLPSQFHDAVRERRASRELQRAVVSLFECGGVFTFTGRLRARATYTARRNTIFQGLAADGAKLALWRLWRCGYRIVNFVHDEVLIEIPETSNREQRVAEIRQIMIAEMKNAVPDVAIDVNATVATYWRSP